jgi:hypothetical protein
MRGLTLGEEAAENGDGYRIFGIPFSPDRASDNEDGDRASPRGDGSGAAPFRGTEIQLWPHLKTRSAELTSSCKFDTFQ